MNVMNTTACHFPVCLAARYGLGQSKWKYTVWTSKRGAEKKLTKQEGLLFYSCLSSSCLKLQQPTWKMKQNWIWKSSAGVEEREVSNDTTEQLYQPGLLTHNLFCFVFSMRNVFQPGLSHCYSGVFYLCSQPKIQKIQNILGEFHKVRLESRVEGSHRRQGDWKVLQRRKSLNESWRRNGRLSEGQDGKAEMIF